MLCPHCSGQTDSDSRFCIHCGKAIEPASREPRRIRIGRAADNDYVIPDMTVSSHHCELTVNSDGSLLLRDLGSKNGTQVNGREITVCGLKQGDQVSVANRIRLDLDEVMARCAVDSRFPAKPSDEASCQDPDTNKNLLSIGREQDNDIVIGNIRVSRHHARLIRIGTTWQIEDLDSKNGTYVNGRKIKTALISAADQITVGGVPLDLKRIFGLAMPDWSADVSLIGRNLSFRVQGRTIVDDISVCFEPGQFVGLIGPSGCGKTTLMMMLNGYLKPTAGQVSINGVSLYRNLQAFQGQMGYVPQDDIIHRELTVRESLQFTSKLRLGRQVSAPEREQQIDRILNSVNLKPAERTLIGSPEKKGISGGQRKRVNMAQELITEPLFYYLDEPTSGLDPRSDREVMLLLKKISDSGHVVLLTTHKIDALNFSILTHLIVLSPGGRLAYYGPARDAVSFFGVDRPEDIFDVLEKTDSRQLKEKYLGSSYCQGWVRPGLERSQDSGSKLPALRHSDILNQFFVLCRRTFLVKYRDFFNAAILLLQAPIIGLFIHLVFKSDEHLATMYFVLIIAAIWLGCSNSAREIVLEQTIFKREQKAALSASAYLWSKIAVITLLSAFQCLILTVFADWSLNLGLGFGLLFLVLTLTSLASLCMGLLLSALVRTGEAAMALVPVTLIPQLILGGMIVPFGKLPEGVDILAGLTISRWAFELLILLEDKEMIIRKIGFDKDYLYLDLAMLAVMICLFISLSFFALKRKTR